nr:MAG TPA: hypothetical protein [Microviridae sp.]
MMWGAVGGLNLLYLHHFPFWRSINHFDRALPLSSSCKSDTTIGVG